MNKKNGTMLVCQNRERKRRKTLRTYQVIKETPTTRTRNKMFSWVAVGCVQEQTRLTYSSRLPKDRGTEAVGEPLGKYDIIAEDIHYSFDG